MLAKTEVQDQVVLVSLACARFDLPDEGAQCGYNDSYLGADGGMIDFWPVPGELNAQPMVSVALVLEQPAVGNQIHVTVIVVITQRW